MNGKVLLVEPGAAIGPYRIGDTWSRLAGRPKPIHDPRSSLEIDRFEAPNLSLWSEGPQDRVTLVSVSLPATARLHEGVGLGSTLAEAAAVFGEPKEECDLVFFRDLPNTSFVLTEPDDPYNCDLMDTKIREITVFWPNPDRGLVAADKWADWHDSLEPSDWGPFSEV